MAKIIQPAKNGVSWAVGRHFKCDGCTKIIEVEADDVIFTYKESKRDPVQFIPCPACDTSIHIRVNNVIRRSNDSVQRMRLEAGEGIE